jgi:hypothetical protein
MQLAFLFGNVVLFIWVSRSILSSRNSVGLAIQPEEKKRRAKVRKKETNVIFAFYGFLCPVYALPTNIHTVRDQLAALPTRDPEQLAAHADLI